MEETPPVDCLTGYACGDNLSSTDVPYYVFPCQIDGTNCSSFLERDEELAKVEMATLVVMFVTSVLGNVAVLTALTAKRRACARTKVPRIYFFMFHLCIADLFTAWLNILPQFAWEMTGCCAVGCTNRDSKGFLIKRFPRDPERRKQWEVKVSRANWKPTSSSYLCEVTFRFKGGDLLCKAVKFGQTFGPYLSSYILTATALDRFQAICHPLTYCSWSSKRARGMLITAWILAITFCIPQIKIFSYQEVAPGINDCWAVFSQPYGERLYVTWYCFSVFVIPLVTLVYTYTCICFTIWRSTGPLSASAPHKVVSRAKINTIKQTVAVILLYISCSSPFISAQLWATWDPNAALSPFLSGSTFTILTLLSSLNSCVNPWIYLISNHDLLEALWDVLSCRKIRERPESLGSGGSTGKAEQKCNLSGQHTHCAKWVVSVPPNVSETEKTMLRLFRAPYSDVWSSVDAHCETTESKLSPEL